MECPNTIEGAEVICFTFIDERHAFTGNCKQIVDGHVQSPMHGLAICQYDGDDSLYLFGCNENWEPVTDTWHRTLDEAINQAEFEYKGTKSTWTKKRKYYDSFQSKIPKDYC